MPVASDGAPFQAKQAHAVVTAMLNYAVEEQKGIEVRTLASRSPTGTIASRLLHGTRTSSSRRSARWLIGLTEQRPDAYTQGAMGRLDLARWL